ncbi:NUDIX hydrolase [Candidatus Parabeggiatoa sp. HSG14]|uniref:NUDIX hydrolase n=1 Tax=Candidatus Parabeggiatoa sp. HSG14 TaxID=3055593 RepID=UPI0025A8D453|nr:NUDIX hydrolase [Thiotrichales bacterium HSG14]
MDWTPHLTVAAIIEHEQRYLLVEEKSDGLIVFNQPAGHWDEGETLIEAAIRETLEEAAWHFEPQAMVGIYQYTSPVNQITYLRICFSGKHYSYEPDRTLDTDILRTVWLTRDEVANLNNLRSPMVLRCIDDYLAGIRYPLSLITEI